MTTTTLTEEIVTGWLREVKDPEIPVADVVGMGIIRGVRLDADRVTVSITPTYSGCPAMEVIEAEIITALKERGCERVAVDMVYSPAWTTDWMEESTRAALKAYGIAPPQKVCGSSPFKSPSEVVTCPRCDGGRVELKSRFGSTACKALYYCNACHEPFEQFKCI
ncbi:MAG: phenylacetate-CoA oxygenase subunit PaaJ [Acidobacteriota bacterium]|nr:phenylacetate-CoA oxygenase subunit PaaJ [Acidobacteriota bacterium]